MVLYNIPGRTGGEHGARPARRARRRSTGSSASSRPTATSCSRSTAWPCSPATTTATSPASSMGGAGCICVASHIVGPEMRRMYDEPEQSRGDRRVAARRLRDAVHHGQPDPGEGGAQPARPRRRARCGCRWSRPTRPRPPRSARCSRATGSSPRYRSVSGTLRVLPLGGVGEIGKNMTVVEYDGRIVARRRGAALPDGRADGDRPRAARLRLPARPDRRHRGDRHHPRPRGSPRLPALAAARAGGGEHPGHLRRPAHRRDGPLQARRAQAAQGAAATCCRPASRSRPARSRSR